MVPYRNALAKSHAEKKKFIKTNYCWNVFYKLCVYSYATKNSVSLILTNNAYKITMFYNIPTHIIKNDGLFN